MNVRFCNSCKTKTQWDSTPVCTQCGCFSDPKDDNTFFSETIEYSEKREVGTSVSGPEKTRVKKIRSGGYRTGASVDSSWETFEKGKRVVSNIASALNLPLVIINSANNTYRLGLD
ncbi:transcription factor TFIIIB subunit brf1, partial [Bonamia ostreae]